MRECAGIRPGIHSPHSQVFRSGAYPSPFTVTCPAAPPRPSRRRVPYGARCHAAATARFAGVGAQGALSGSGMQTECLSRDVLYYVGILRDHDAVQVETGRFLEDRGCSKMPDKRARGAAPSAGIASRAGHSR